MPLSGHATPDATKAYADRIWQETPTISPDSWRILEGLTVGKIGFGAYRLTQSEDHEAALGKALLSGINLIDTSTNYTGGESEFAIGRVLGLLAKAGKITREEITLVSKAGYIQGEELIKAQSTPPKECVVMNEHLWHCIHPTFLDAQLTASSARLDVETVDVFLLHNPEYYLMHAHASGEDADVATATYYKHLEAAFTFLEEAAKEGRIQYYGISSNTLPHPKDDPVHTDLARVFEAAQAAAQKAWGRKKRPLFRVIEMPINVLELGALKEANTHAKTLKNDELVPTLELASRMHLAVLANRPLNAFPLGGGAFRLVSPPLDESDDISDALLEELSAGEIALNTAIGGWPTLGEEPLFNFANQGAALFAQVENLIHLEQIEHALLRPHMALLTQTLEDLKTQNPDKVDAIDAFLTAREKQLPKLYAALHRTAARKSAEQVHPLYMEMLDRVDSEWQEAPLQELALGAISSLPGVTCTLCGLRDKAYITSALNVYTRGDFKDPARVIGAAKS